MSEGHAAADPLMATGTSGGTMYHEVGYAGLPYRDQPGGAGRNPSATAPLSAPETPRGEYRVYVFGNIGF